MTGNHKYIGTWLTMKSLVISLTYFCVLACTCVHVHVYRDACVYMCVEARGHPWVSILKWQISGAVHFVKTISHWSLPPQCWDYHTQHIYIVSKGQTQELKLEQQAFY